MDWEWRLGTDGTEDAVAAALDDLGGLEIGFLEGEEARGRLHDREAHAARTERAVGGLQEDLGDAVVAVVGRVPDKKVKFAYPSPGQSVVRQDQLRRNAHPRRVEARRLDGPRMGVDEGEGGLGKVDAAGGVGDEEAHEAAAAAHVEQVEAGGALGSKRLDLAGGDLGEGEAPVVRAPVAEAAGQRGERHLPAAGHARLPVGREGSRLPGFAPPHGAEEDGMLRPTHDVDGRPDEPHRLQGGVGVALEGREQAAALREREVDVLQLVQHKFGRHRARRRHEERGHITLPDLRRAEDVFGVEAAADQVVADRARVMGVEGVRADGRLRPGAHRLRHDHAAAVTGNEDAPRTRRRGQHLLQQQGLRVGEPLPVRRHRFDSVLPVLSVLLVHVPIIPHSSWTSVRKSDKLCVMLVNIVRTGVIR